MRVYFHRRLVNYFVAIYDTREKAGPTKHRKNEKKLLETFMLTLLLFLTPTLFKLVSSFSQLLSLKACHIQACAVTFIRRSFTSQFTEKSYVSQHFNCVFYNDLIERRVSWFIQLCYCVLNEESLFNISLVFSSHSNEWSIQVTYHVIPFVKRRI